MGLLANLLDLVYPERCAACDAHSPAPGLCPACSASLYPLGVACPRCANPEEALAALVCARCRRRPPPFTCAFAPFRYGGELAAAMRRFKYGGARGGGRLELARSLGVLLAAPLADACRGADLVVPVPLHPGRLRERGFSQAHVLAQVAHRIARPPARLAAFALRRTRATGVQAGLTRAERLRNVAGAFAADGVRGQRVLLVDDVITTCATAAACARALRAAGASEVAVLALARAES